MVKEIDGHGVNYKIMRDAYSGHDNIARRSIFFEVGEDGKCSENEELVFADLAKHPDFDRDTLHIWRTHDDAGMPCHIIMPPVDTPILRTGRKRSVGNSAVSGNSIS